MPIFTAVREPSGESRISSMSVAHGEVSCVLRGKDMFGKSSDQLIDELRGVAPSRTTKGNGAAAQPIHSGVAQPAATPETPEKISSLGPGMTIIGKIDCEGTLHIFGRIEGEL